MIDLYYWLMPNGHGISISVEKIGLGDDLNSMGIRQGAPIHGCIIAMSNR